MESRAKILGHPVHQILVMFPLGMLGWSVACDAMAARTGKAKHAEAARRALGAGVALAAVAAPFGLRDWLAIPKGTRAKSIGRLHGVGNAGVLALFTASWLLRRRRPGSTLAKGLSLAGFGLSGATAWLGTELINRLGVGVYAPTSLDAPSSLHESKGARIAGEVLEDRRSSGPGLP